MSTFTDLQAWLDGRDAANTRALADVQAKLDAANASVSAEQAARTLAESAATKAKADLVTVQAAFDAYKASHPDTQPPPVTPPAASKVLYGADASGYFASAGRPNPATGKYEDNDAAYARIVAGFGNLQVVRLWPNRISSSWSDLIPARVGKRGVYVNLGSDIGGVNAGNYDTAFTALMKSAPTDQRIWLSIAHEPENDGIAIADWQKAQVRLGKIKTANAPKNVRWAPLLMGTTFMVSATKPLENRWNSVPGSPGPATDWFNFDLSDVDCIGADIYQWGKPGSNIDPASRVIQPILDFAQARGKGVVVGEFGARSLLSDDEHVKFLTEGAALYNGSGITEAVCYYESSGGTLGPWNLLPSFPKAAAYWSTLTK